MVTYYQYIGIPKKGRNPSYQKFKAQHLPFPWDKIRRGEDDDLETMEEVQEQVLSPSDWAERISKLQGGKEASLDDLKGKV